MTESVSQMFRRGQRDLCESGVRRPAALELKRPVRSCGRPDRCRRGGKAASPCHVSSHQTPEVQVLKTQRNQTYLTSRFPLNLLQEAVFANDLPHTTYFSRLNPTHSPDEQKVRACYLKRNLIKLS